MMTATAALEHQTRHASTRGSRTRARSSSTGAGRKIDDADRKGMGWMTFEDGVAFSRNVVAAKVALEPRHVDPRVVGDPLRHVAQARLRRPRPASTSPTRSSGIVRDPGLKPWAQIDLANGAFGQGVAVTPIQLATAYAALMNGGTSSSPTS